MSSKNKIRTWILSIGDIADHSLIFQENGKFLTEDGLSHEMPPLFPVRGTIEDVKQRVCECLDKFAEALEKDDANV